MSIEDRLRLILTRCAKLKTPAAQLTDTGDLFDAGLDSLAVVDVMLAIETEFDIELPDSLLNRGTFSSIGALAAAVGHVQSGTA